LYKVKLIQVSGVVVIRHTMLLVVLVVALVSAPVAAAVGPAADDGHAALGDAPPAQADEQCTFPVTKTDATGRQVTVTGDPDEVFTLGPSAAQTMWEIGAQDEVVGVSYSDISYVDYLPGVEDKTNAGNPGFTPISTSVVVNEDPDLVLAANIIPDEKIRQLRDAGLTVYKFREATSVDFVVQKTRDYGELVGRCEDADERADQMETEVDLVRSAVADVDHPEGVYITGSSGYAAGEGTFVNELVEGAGIDNVASERVDGYAQLSREVVLAEDPAWLVQSREFDLSPYAGSTFYEEDQVIRVDPNYISQPGPRVVDAMQTIVKTVHPDAYEQADLDELDDDDEAGKWTAVDADGVAVLTAENAPGATSAFEFPDGFEANDSVVHMETLEVTAVESGRTYLTTVGHSDVYTGDQVTGVPVVAYTLEAGGLTDAEFVNATVEFSVPRAALDARDADGDDVQVWVSSRISWFDVRTTVVNESDDGVRLRATIPREAPFVVTMPAVVDEPATVENGTPTATATATPDGDAATTPDPTETPAAAATGGDATTPDSTATATATPRATAGETPTTGSGPGPGVLGSLVAFVAAAALLARRR
jgi:iron complex transport system substrate-binding protein